MYTHINICLYAASWSGAIYSAMFHARLTYGAYVSVQVRAADVARFHAELSVLLRANASALKKKDRKSKKSRSKSQAAQ